MNTLLELIFCAHFFTNNGSQSRLLKLMTLVNKGILMPLSLIIYKFYFLDVLIIQWISKKIVQY